MSLELDVVRLQERILSIREAIKLQAIEYERRLSALNHAHEKAVEVQHTYVTQEKYDDYIVANADQRELAIGRVDEKLHEHIRRWEMQVQEVNRALSTLREATIEAKRLAESEGRELRLESHNMAQSAKDTAAEAQRRQNRSITILGFALAFIVGVANLIPALL